MKRASLCLPVLFFLTACASSHNSTEIDLRKVNNVAVISVMDAPALASVDTDKIITQEVISSLKSRQKNSFSLAVDNKYIQSERDQALALQGVYLGNRYQNLQKYLVDQAIEQKADYLLVIHPAPHPQFASYAPGYGLHCSLTQSQGELQGYFMMSSELWDIRKKEVVARAQISPAELNFNTGKKCQGTAISKNLVSSYKENLLNLAKKSSSLILNRVGIIN